MSKIEVAHAATVAGRSPLAIILPERVSIAECIGPHKGDLFSEELALVKHALPQRRQEFAAGRTCARIALRRLGLANQPILVGSNRQPIWPSTVAGSITHCSGYCAAAVAWKAEIVSLGIDAELNDTLPKGVIREVATESEVECLSRGFEIEYGGMAIALDCLIFSAKEALYKAWFPVMQSWLDFKDVNLYFEPRSCTFHFEFVDRSKGAMFKNFSGYGRFGLFDKYILTSVILVRH